MKVLEEQALEDESGYQEDEVIHIHFYEPANTILVVRSCVNITCFKMHLMKIYLN